jgi:signal transduction histidine kinase
MLFATGGQEALELLATQSVDVIVADTRMPAMSGTELLAEVRQRHPQVVRLTLSGLEHDVVARSSIGLAYQCLLKPCDTEILKAALHRALSFGDLLVAIRGAPAFDINETLRRMIATTRSDWERFADVSLALAPDLPPLPCELTDLATIVINLMANAIQAVSDAIGNAPGTKGQISVATASLPGGTVELRISDTGAGIPLELHPTLFEPAIDARPPGKGFGQGLAVARVLVEERHGGSLSFESQVGRGTTFFVRLPVHAHSAKDRP